VMVYQRDQECIGLVGSMTVEWHSVSALLTLSFVVRCSVSRTRKNERRRGHRSVRKHVVQRKLFLGVMNKCSLRASGHVLLRTDRLFSFVRETSQ
jgi:hypothetical protein